MTLMSESRRRLLLAAPALATALAPAAARSEAPLRTPAHIVIVGSGLGGIAVAARLRKQLDGARITLVDGKRWTFSKEQERRVRRRKWEALRGTDTGSEDA